MALLLSSGVARVLDETTRRLEETGDSGAPALTTAILWNLPDARRVVSPLESPRLTLGRGEGRDVRLEAAGVSRFHAEIVREGPVYVVLDRNSTNGTYVNGDRVSHSALSAGDVIRLGEAIGVVMRRPLEHTTCTEVVVGDAVFGPGLAELLSMLRRAGPTLLPIVIVGETGAGKDAVARVLHHFSGRPGPFHAVNCAALPATLAEAELFGYRKGAFTGAEQAAVGHFRRADGGTLFLDELADIPLPTQAKLLRALQDGEVMPLGESKSIVTDVRLLAAVQQPLGELVKARRLREDLAMRLQGLVVTIPPLRERREDIPLLFHHFLRRHAGGRAPNVDPRLLERLIRYDWPGNVRELELLARQLVALHGHERVLRKGMLPESFGASVTPQADAAPRARSRKAQDLERLKAALVANRGNMSRAAASIGMSRSRAYRLLESEQRSERSEADEHRR
ncbi:MAG: sigma 54-interacting transcriptional regulator [Pseudomonadota bacterium]